MKATTHILLVDDESRNLDVLESILQSPDYHLVRAQTADEALLALVDGDFAAIVLDIRMPGMSGIELANLVKQRKRTRHIPIIFLTAYFQEDRYILEGYEVGAVDFLTKPVNPQILRSKVAVFADLFRSARALAEANQALEQEVVQRKQAEAALRQANAELDARVKQRTADLTQANQSLQQRERHYRELVQSLPAAVYTTDAEGRIVLFNEAAVALWGRAPEPGKTKWCGSYRIYQPDGTPLPLDQCPMALALREGRSVRGKEILIERADGTRRHVLPYPEPLRDAAGNLVGAVNMLVDLTERRRAEEALRQSEERLRLALETALDAIVTIDGQGRITGWNPQAEQIFGWSQAEALGKTLSETIVPAEHREAHEQVLRPYLQTGQGAALRERIEMTALDRRGRRFPVEISLTPAVVGEKVYLTAFLRDITERKRAEAVLQESEARLAAASRAKDDFLAVLSHELRTPLNPVLLLASEAAEDESLPAEARARFASIRNNVELEARLIDDLLDLTRIARGKLGLQLGLVDAHAVLQNAIATVRAELDQKHIALVLTLAAGRHQVPGDEVRLQQIIWNLIKNSVKFTPPHGTITVETVSSEDERRIFIKITDTGIGMTEEEIERVFHAFSQGDHASGTGLHRFGGMGLGLAISRMLVELHGGGICAHSAGRGKGATFVIDLPLAPAAQARDERPDAAANHEPRAAETSRAGGALQFRHILLVEDHEPTRTVLSQLLVRRKFKVTTAGSVEEAMAAAYEDSIDLLISDIGLPDGNGFDL
ncbi:MAG TPA: PAS domain S-box protein, partial [Candidatus Saccharimonadales bacterium]|nr:PAS domain S-box protein [Candidatus Saccharimonadales bacterium]